MNSRPFIADILGHKPDWQNELDVLHGFKLVQWSDNDPLTWSLMAVHLLGPVGSTLKDLRTSACMTQEDLASQLCIWRDDQFLTTNEATISRIESGKRLPQPEEIIQLRRIFSKHIQSSASISQNLRDQF